MFDNDAVMMLSLFKRVYPLEPEPTTAEEYLKSYGPEIDGIGRALQLLGLAEESDTCALGWRPTEALVRLIADRVAHSSDHNAKVDNCNIINSIFYFAVRDLGVTNVDDDDNMFVEEVTEFGCEILRILGLAKSDSSGYRPTRALQQLVFSRYLEAATKHPKT